MPVQPILEQLVTAVVILDRRGHIQFANAAAESLLAGSSRRLQGAPLESLLRYSSLEFQLLHDAMANQQSLSDSDVVWVLHDGKQMTVELVVSPCTLDNGAGGQLLELRQVDLIRRLNQEQVQQHQLAAAQQLIRGLAHEIKNPLGGIRGAAQLLSLKLREPGLEDYTSLIIKQSDRLRELVDRLLGPNQPGQREETNVHQLIEQVIQVVELDKPEAVMLTKDYDPSLPPIAVVEHQIEQVLLNIVKNAVYAVGSQGEVSVRTRIAHQETIYGKRYRQCLLLAVTDTGPGVPAELKDTLFYPLVSGREGGSGLGLSIAQSLVHQHAGKIEVSSRPGHTEFLIYLPYPQPTDPENSRIESTHIEGMQESNA
ncbi:nitrogen regulation protein NR(II) [Aliidiomarina sedimenti]|uniref:Sensory histidine kinase/phosphatase NtrB n=1 Tax=Aliidiomarina sedimenti TaxID=1933879 RepID=A0ABY0BYC8_9GAMM|nr:nitrogen regulation protein NR(II) [Aliidiomarina sedimenti]RUO29429.1 nitrogen regulation protein NR(II) [Aliidiomarina sedimenti]